MGHFSRHGQVGPKGSFCAVWLYESMKLWIPFHWWTVTWWWKLLVIEHKHPVQIWWWASNASWHPGVKMEFYPRSIKHICLEIRIWCSQVTAIGQQIICLSMVNCNHRLWHQVCQTCLDTGQGVYWTTEPRCLLKSRLGTMGAMSKHRQL